MIKRLLALLLVSTLLLTACNSEIKNEDIIRNDSKIVDGTITADNHMDFDVNPEIFSDLSDENLLQYVEDEVYAGITEQLASEDYIVALGMGEKHVIAVSKNQTIYAWGDNGQYQLGSNISIDHTWRPLDITAKFPPIINYMK